MSRSLLVVRLRLPLAIVFAITFLNLVPTSGTQRLPPQPNDIFGTVDGCADALVEMDDNQDGMIKRGEYLGFVNMLAYLLCIPPRPILDLELQTVFFSISCLCQDREGFSNGCCEGNSAAIYTQGASDAVTRTEEQDSYLRAACLLTEAVLGPPQCTRAPQTISPGAIGIIERLPAQGNEGLTNAAKYGMIAGAIAVLLLCCLLFCCACCRRDEEQYDSDEEEVEVKEEIIVEKTELVPFSEDFGKNDPEKGVKLGAGPLVYPAPTSADGERSIDAPTPALASHPTSSSPLARSIPPADGVAEDGSGRRYGHSPNDDGDDAHGRKFRGEGHLPPPPDILGVKLRHVEVEPGQQGNYEYPERSIEEHKLKREDSAQVLDHYIPDGGVYDPQRAKKPPVIFNLPKYQRPKKSTEEYIDLRKLRKQLGLGDGEVWDALASYEKDGITSKLCRRFHFKDMHTYLANL